MTARGNKQININGTVFSFDEFMANPDAYMPLMQPLFQARVLTRRPTDTNEDFYWRLFYLLYYKREGYAVNCTSVSAPVQRVRRTRRTNQETSDNACHILDALGIDVIKYNPKISKVIFKNSGNVYRMKNSDMDALSESLKKNVSYDRNEFDVSLGIELEFIGNRNKIHDFEDAMMKLVGHKRFENKGCYNKNDGKKWILGTDSSVDSREGWPMSGYELTSPILHFTKKDMKELHDVMECIQNTMQGYTNNTCGTHVHMSFACDCANDEICAHFAKSYKFNEDKLFDKLVPNRRRGNNSRWCRCTSYINMFGYNNRYRKLNFNNVKKNSTNLHLEFRQLDGTLDYDKLYQWIKLQKMFVELTMDSYTESRAIGEEKINRLDLNEVVTNKELDQSEVETLLKMGHIVAA